MRRSLRFTLFLGAILITNFVQSQSDRFAYAVTDVNKGGANWSFLRKLDLQTGAYSDVILSGNDASRLAYDAATKKQMTAPLTDARFGNLANAAFGTGVAAAAYDKKHNRLYYTPMFIDQLRYIDLQTMNVYFVNGSNLTGNAVKAGDQSNIITRMVIDETGTGYALTNDGTHLIQFSTGKKLNLTDFGSLVDAAENKGVSVHNSCSSFGGDMIADNDGNLFVFSARNHVFRVNIETKVAAHLGTISGLPANFTINGAAVDENNRILVTSAVDASSLYTVDPKTWTAAAFKASVAPWQTADLANSNILQTRTPVSAPELIASKVGPVNSAIQLYPNPVTTNKFNITFNEAETGSYTVQVTDSRGQLIAQKNVAVGGKGQTVSGITLPAPAAKGIYIVKVNDPNSKTVYSNKIVVQ
ncbi:MAG TPA: T9SS type A sorting domain-containing protein [Chitinophagaceae bacterium]|nr:T9SS type A sorting domain-containing protein [Chitinophagaceae bacterium]